jgi:PPM family protein phosphatase
MPGVLRGKIGAQEHSRKGILTRAIGAETIIEIDLQWIEFAQFQRFVLCSDGLSDAIPEAKLFAQFDQEFIAQALVQNALKANASDNVTAICIEF